MPAEEKKYNPGFDLIRITSMMAVMLIHLTTYLPIPNRWKFLFTWGSAGVPLFFVLSGFLAARTFVCGGGYCCLLQKTGSADFAGILWGDSGGCGIPPVHNR